MPHTAELSPNACGCRRGGTYSVQSTGGTDSSSPPPKPWTSRATAIISSELADPPMAVPTAKAAEPTSSVRHGPARSESAPPIGWPVTCATA